MAKSALKWDGLKEYLEALKKLPEECQGEAAKLIEGEVNAAYVAISSVYGAHRRTGKLQKGLRITQPTKKGQLVAGRVLTSGAKIAWLFDNGSQARHWASGKSTGTMWGKTPPTHIFTRTVEKAGRQLTQHYTDMLLRRGATSVTGE